MSVIRKYIGKLAIYLVISGVCMGGIFALLLWLNRKVGDDELVLVVRIVGTLFGLCLVIPLARMIVSCVRVVGKLQRDGIACLDAEYPYGMRVGKITATDHFVVYLAYNNLIVVPTHEIMNVTSSSTDVATTSGMQYAYAARSMNTVQCGIVVVTRGYKRYRMLPGRKSDWKQVDELIRYIYARKPQYPAGGPGMQF